MKLVHISDLHLGFKQYHRQARGGINQREADVALAFRKTIDAVIECSPQIVLIAGDVFHSVRPSNPAILHAYSQFSRLARALPEAHIVMVAGNHDTPRTSETGCILQLFRSLNIHVVANEAQQLPLIPGELSVLAVPDCRRRPVMRPDPAVRFNVMLLHGEVEGCIRRLAGLQRVDSELVIDRSELGVDRWDYIALGHYHVYHQLAPNAYYSGAIEYASTDIWGEVDDEAIAGIKGKGFIEHDLETGEHTFHVVPLARRVVDLPGISAEGKTAEELDRLIREAVEACDGGIDDRIVRLVIREIPRHVLRELNHAALREYRRRALHFLLDARRPQPVRSPAQGLRGRRASLTDAVRHMLETRRITPGVDRAELVRLGLTYLSEADRSVRFETEEVA